MADLGEIPDAADSLGGILVQKLMQRHGIRARGKRRFKVTTDSRQDLPISPSLLNREFTVHEPDRVWAGGITYIATDEGWLFLSVVIDLFNRQVIGWSLRSDMTRDIVIDALRMAWFKRHLGKETGLIFHSDRGSQGGFNRSSQHLQSRRCYEKTCGVDAGVNGTRGDALAWCSFASA